jgi:hypothetical protein
VAKIVLASGSLGEGEARAPAPVRTFAHHRAAIVQLVVVEEARVASVDRDRVALIWDPQTAAVIARSQLPDNAIACSLSSTREGLAYVAQDAGGLAIHAFADHRVLARVVRNDLPSATLAHCSGDLARVVLASEGDLVVVPLAGGAPLVRATVETHEPEVLAIEPRGTDYLVRFHHVGMDMYPTDEEAIFEGSTLRVLERRHEVIEVRSPLASRPSLRVQIERETARVFVADRPLPDLVAHASAICLSAWIGSALWTADRSGTLHGWDVERLVAVPRVPAHHAVAITDVRFTSTGVVSFTATDTKLWRDDALVATLPAIAIPIIDEETQRLSGVGTAYSLRDGASLGTYAAASNHAFGSRVIGRRGLITVRLQDSHPIRILEMRDDAGAIRERMLPAQLDAIVSQSAPPIVHAGRLVVTHYNAPTRSIALATLAVHAERHLHAGGTVWAALHPDGTLYSAGYSDGDLARSDALTLAERARWTIFEGSDAERAIHAAVLLPNSARVVVAGTGRLRRYELDRGMLARLLRGPVDLAVTERAEELVADAAEQRVVVFPTTGAAKVLDVERMAWVEARPGELEAARTRRKRSPLSEAHGFAHAFACDGDRWLVGWSYGLSITAFAASKRTLRAPFSTLIAPKADTLRGALVDDTRDELWVLCKTGALARTSLVRDEPFETVTTIAGGAQLAWASPSTFAVQTETGALHILATTGERVCTFEGFAVGRCALAGSTVVCPQPDGALRVAAIPGDSYLTLRDARATAAASAIAIAAPFVASRHANQVLRWDLRTRACTGAWTAPTTLTAIDVREDGAVLAGEANGVVTVLR